MHNPDNEPDVIDCTGVLIGNSDIGVPEWVPTNVQPGTTPLPIYPNTIQANVPSFDETAPQPFIQSNPREGVDLAWRPNGYGHHYHTAARADCLVVVEDRWTSAFAIVRGPERGASAVRETLPDAKAWASAKARELGALA